jgi:hypothetical protein
MGVAPKQNIASSGNAALTPHGAEVGIWHRTRGRYETGYFDSSRLGLKDGMVSRSMRDSTGAEAHSEPVCPYRYGMSLLDPLYSSATPERKATVWWSEIFSSSFTMRADLRGFGDKAIRGAHLIRRTGVTRTTAQSHRLIQGSLTYRDPRLNRLEAAAIL